MRKTLHTALICLFTALQANAEIGKEFTIGKATYIIKSDSTVGISHFDDKVLSYELSNEVNHDGNKYTVIGVEDEAFRYCEIKEIKLPETIRYIGKQAFGSSKIQTIQLPKNLRRIENHAFYACRELKSIKIPEGVTQLGSSKSGSTFGACSKLQSVILPSTLDTIWDATFYHNSSLKNVNLPENVKYLGTNAFNACDSLQQVTLSSNLVQIADGVFGDCKMLSKINNISDKLTAIGIDAFYNCPITEFTIPASCTIIGDRAFAGTKIKEFKLSPDNKSFTLIGKSIYTADKKLLMFYPPYASEKEVVIENHCRGINIGAFMGAQINQVTIPESVTAIGDYAFCLSTVSDVKMSDSIIYIGEQAFAATNIKSISLPDGIGQLNTATFAGCESLTSVTIPSGVKSIGIRQFWNCKKLKEIHFLGYNAPEVDYWEYPSEAPFYGIDSKAITIYCPKGRTANYESNYSEYDQIGTIQDKEEGIIVPSSISPANEEQISTLNKLTFTFNEDVNIANAQPSIKVICGKEIAHVPVGEELPIGMWSINQINTKEFNAMILDKHGENGTPVNMEEGKKYYVIIPAGIFKNAEGLYNEAITLKYSGVSTGISEIQNTEFYIVKKANCLEIHLANKAASSIQLYNAAGQLINSGNNTTGTFSFEGLRRGVYIVKIESESGKKSIKVMM